ncbi:SUN domain-containing protein 2-like isoform X3 [Protopterus annectens]|uniref:SUN domain-containing protein 2-like isoform X3 n=1 Tax=Protopterus annectens TaxID=7888 RepID=UPI001CFA6010|nr:SUN domain-containing protein 2-like isoform X3 [Protopterus annectens]
MVLLHPVTMRKELAGLARSAAVTVTTEKTTPQSRHPGKNCRYCFCFYFISYFYVFLCLQRNDIAQALRLYSEDRTGLVDYALKSTGAKVINTGDTETYGTCFPRLWCYYHAEAILEPDVSRGNCWAFKGHKGSATIQLPVTIRPTGFSVEHIPKSMSPTGRIDNAPKDFSVYGLDNPNDKLETLLGKFTYDQNGTPVQTFFIQPKDVKTYKIIELRVESNWGNPTHTCIYRFRVHGDLQK